MSSVVFWIFVDGEITRRRNHVHPISSTTMSTFRWILLTGFVFVQAATAQTVDHPRLHEPTEILQIMEKSPISYHMQNGNEKKLLKEMEAPVMNSELHLLRGEDGVMDITAVKHTAKGSALFQGAESLFSQHKYDAALLVYWEIHGQEPAYEHVHALIGDAHYQAGNLDSAAYHFEEAIRKNPIDYQAHWFLADTYSRMGRDEDALRTITRAHLLNRNHEMLKKVFLGYRDKSGKKWKEWSFRPAYRVEVKDQEVVITAPAKWLPYAMAKAVWKSEPGYAESVLGPGVSSGNISWYLAEEFEAMSMLDPKEEKRLAAAMEKDMLVPFILYEYMSIEKPWVFYMVDDGTIDKVIAYLDEFH